MITGLIIFAYVFIGFIMTILIWWVDTDDDEEWTAGMFLACMILWPLVIIVGIIGVAVEAMKDLKKSYYNEEE